MSNQKKAKAARENAPFQGEPPVDAKNMAGSDRQNPLPHNSKKEGLGPNTKR